MDVWGEVYRWVTILAIAALNLVVLYAIRLCRADCDLGLFSKAPPPKGAFQDKVVWVVGASQVR